MCLMKDSSPLSQPLFPRCCILSSVTATVFMLLYFYCLKIRCMMQIVSGQVVKSRREGRERKNGSLVMMTWFSLSLSRIANDVSAKLLVSLSIK